MLLSELNEPSFGMETVSYCAVAALLGSNRTGIKQIYIYIYIYIYTEISDSRSFLKSSLQQIGSDFFQRSYHAFTCIIFLLVLLFLKETSYIKFCIL